MAPEYFTGSDGVECSQQIMDQVWISLIGPSITRGAGYEALQINFSFKYAKCNDRVN